MEPYTSTLLESFPSSQMDEMMAIFVLYDCTTNLILATPLKCIKEETMIAMFEDNIKYLAK